MQVPAVQGISVPGDFYPRLQAVSAAAAGVACPHGEAA
jgi:hypothetical protein